MVSYVFFFIYIQTFYPSGLSSQQIAMGDQRQDSSNLEMDCAEDFSLIKSRLESFHGSSLVQQVPAERLARAGFYFVGPSDRVRCFSCRKTVENWCRGDRPVERHKEVSLCCFRKQFALQNENFINLELYSSWNYSLIFIIVVGFSILQISQLHLSNQFQPDF